MLSIKIIGGGGASALSVGAAAAYYEKQGERQREAQTAQAGGAPAKAMDEYMLAGVAATAQPRWFSIEGKLAPNDSPIMPGELRQMLDGIGLDGTQLVQAAKRNQRVGGWDLTFSTPKAVGALWATASPELRGLIMEDMTASARAGLRALHDRGVFETRRGKNGSAREVATDVAAAMFPHVTSRAGDPQPHVHCVLINAGRRADGTTGALDVPGVYAWKTYAGAIFRAEMADRLAMRGVAILEDGQAFTVAGLPPELIKVWSKRRGVILDALDKVGADLEEGATQEAAAATAPGVKQGPLRDADSLPETEARGKRLRLLKEEITQSTRRPKDSLPANGDLERRWLREMEGLGLTREKVWQAVSEAAERHQTPKQTAGDAAIGEALERSAVVTERTLRRLVAEHAQTRGGGAEGAHAGYDGLIASGRLIALQPNRRGEMVYSTAETLARERRMLLDAVERRGQGGLIRPAAADAAIAARPTLSSEQARAIRHTARGDGVVVVEGVAGSGKSFAMAAVVDAAHRSGARVIGLAPSWTAADVLRAETSLPGARALQGFVQGLDAGRIRFGRGREAGVQHLGERVVLLVDEAGMASSRDTALLLAHARAGGAQVVLVGDRRQLHSVEPGAPFAALADALGVSRMEDVRRQTGWQREASAIFAAGDSVEGLTRYDAKGRVRWAGDGEAAVRKVADAWEKNRQHNPDASRLVLAARNADVHAINREIRSRLVAAGELGTEVITVRTMHAGGRRGANGEAREMELRTGDRVALGVTLIRTGRNVLANDVATVTGITPGRDPALTLRLDRTGHTETLSLSELAPPARRGQEHRQLLPVLQHAYARTIHKSQGQTADFTVVHAGDGLDASRAYVALTRHRRDAVIVADAGAIAHWLAEGGTLPTRDAIRQAFLRAAKGDTDGLNAGDYVVDRGAWLRTGDPQGLPATARETRGQAVIRIAAETAARLGQRIRSLRQIDVPAYIKDALSRRRTATPAPAQPAPLAARPAPQQPATSKPKASPRPAHQPQARARPAGRPATWVKVSEADATAQLRDALDRAGFAVSRMGLPVMDGQRHYAPLKEDRGPQQRGAYRAHYDGVRPAGAIWNHRTGEVSTWKADGAQVALDPAEADKLARRQAALVARRERETARREGQGATAAQRLVDTSRPASPTHPYLVAKGISSDGLRQDPSGRLVIPLTIDGKLANAQTILADGTKRLVYGARKVGAHFVIGEIRPGEPIAIAEGLATAKSFHQASGLATVMALDTGNLAPVAEALRNLHRTALLVFAADNDAHLPRHQGDRTMPNVGVMTAKATAAKVGHAVVLTAPELPARTAADKGTHWNDVAAARGIAATRAAVQALQNAQTQTPAPTQTQTQAPTRGTPAPSQTPRRGPRMRL